MLIEGIMTLILVGSLFYVAPGVLGAVRTAAPTVYAAAGTGVPAGAPIDSGLNASVTSIATTAAGSLNLSAIGLIMLGIAIMIGGFMLIRGYGRQ